MESMNDTLAISNYILGDVSVNFLIAFYFYAIIGVVFNLLVHYTYKQVRNKRKQNKYTKFSYKYWILDNYKRFLLNLLSIYLIVIFKDNIPILKDYNLNMFLGFVTGMSLDTIVIILRKLNLGSLQSK
jgi:hypothetical protein